MRFAYPLVLWALLLLPALAAFLAWSLRRRRILLERYASAKLLPLLGGDPGSWRLWMRPAMILFASTLLIFAAARPQWGHEDRKIISRGVDIMVAVDTSASMLAQDYRPNRLERAKQLLQDIIWRARGDRVGVMAFAGSAAIQSPLTLDYSMASAALKSLGPGSVSAGGTALGKAIDAAVQAFKTGSAGERVLIVLTDGEDQGSEPIEAAQRAAEAGVKIYTVGIGTSQGGATPTDQGPKTDRSGEQVVSKLDFETLTRIAQITGGKAVKANPRGGAELDTILGDLEQLAKAEQQDRIYRVYQERFQWFLFPAILVLVWESLQGGAGRRRPTRKGTLAKS